MLTCVDHKPCCCDDNTFTCKNIWRLECEFLDGNWVKCESCCVTNERPARDHSEKILLFESYSSFFFNIEILKYINYIEIYRLYIDIDII